MSERKKQPVPPQLAPYVFKKGQSGNPKGRVKNRTFEQIVKSVLDEHIGDSGINKLEVLARVVVDEAIQTRNVQIIKILADRLWPQTNVHEIEDRRPPVEVKPQKSIEEMRETFRRVGQFVDAEVIETEATR